MALKKKFNEVELSLFNERVFVIGDKNNLLNRNIKIDVSKRLKGKSCEIIFFIKEIEGKLLGIPRKFNVFRNYIVKLIRKKTSYVEDSFDVKCKDVVARIKPFLITRRKVPRSLKRSLREKIRELIIEDFKEKNFFDIFELLINESIQKEIAKKIKKIYPPLAFEIRVFETKEIDKIEFKKN